MKKFFKFVLILIIIISITFCTYYFRNEISTFLIDGYYTAEEYIKENYLGVVKEDDVYSEEEIRRIINETNNIPNVEYTSKIDTYYYEKLNNNARIIYRVFKDNLNEIKTGSFNIKLPSILEETLKTENGQEKLNKDFQDAWDAIKLDMPEIFYVNVDKMCLMTKTTTRGSRVDYELCIQTPEGESSLPKTFSSENEVDAAITSIEKVKNQITEKVQNNDFAKILYAHNWIIDNLKYDSTTTKDNNANIYGALINKEVVCEGYAKTFKYLLDEMNIPCVLVCGVGIDETGKQEKHAWNYVYLQGSWYAVDTTWDDPIIIGNGIVDGSIKYKYFLKGKDDFSKNHFENGQFTNNGIVFKYPELNKVNYKTN